MTQPLTVSLDDCRITLEDIGGFLIRITVHGKQDIQFTWPGTPIDGPSRYNDYAIKLRQVIAEANNGPATTPN